MSDAMTNDEGDLQAKCVANCSNQTIDDVLPTDYDDMCLLTRHDFHMDSDHLTEGNTDEYLVEVML